MGVHYNKMAGWTNPYLSKRFSCSDYQRPELAEDQVQEIKEVFDLFDYNYIGAIIVEELRQHAIDTLGHQARDRLISKIIKSADIDGSGLLSFDEFLHMVLTTKTCDEKTREDFRQVIGLHYHNKNGFLRRRQPCEARIQAIESISSSISHELPQVETGHSSFTESVDQIPNNRDTPITQENSQGS